MWKQLKNMWEEDNLLDQAWQKSYEMLKIDEEMFLEAVRVLRESDEMELRREIRRKDKQVNKYEREVRRDVLTHLSVQGPNEIPAGLVLATVIVDIERIGDYTKNIVDLAEAHPKTLKGDKYQDELVRVEEAIKEMFVKVRVCVEQSDEEGAVNLLDEFKWINKTCDSNVFALIKEKDKKLSPGAAVALALYFRYLKRISAHFRNIISSIVNPFDRIGYKVKG